MDHSRVHVSPLMYGDPMILRMRGTLELPVADPDCVAHTWCLQCVPPSTDVFLYVYLTFSIPAATSTHTSIAFTRRVHARFHLLLSRQDITFL